MAKDIIVKVSDLINRNFYELFNTLAAYVIAKGGRSSFKSSVIAIWLVMAHLQDLNGNVIVLRKVAKYLHGSVYNQIRWAMAMLRVEDQYIFGRSPLQIIHKKSGTGFYFYGVDDPMKIKSAKIAKGYVRALWFEELAEFKGVEDIDIVTDTFIREKLAGGKKVKVFYSYNPPRNPYSWVNQWVKSKESDPEYYIHHSTYLEDEKGFLSGQLLLSIEKYKETDPDYYRWMYLGEVIGLGDNVYNASLFQLIDELPEDDYITGLYYAIDAGHMVSAMTYLCIGITRSKKVVLIDTYYYSPAGKIDKKAPSDQSEDLNGFISRTSRLLKKPIKQRTIDSAEGALRNQYRKDYGIDLHPVAKKRKHIMISYVWTLLAQGRVYVLNNENNKIFMEEHERYTWDKDTLQSENPEVVKENDHTCDAFQYFVMDNLYTLGLKN